jgi:hypothetical protein
MAKRRDNDNGAAAAVAELEQQQAALGADLERVRAVKLDAVRNIDAAAQREGRRLALEAALDAVAVDLATARAAVDVERSAEEVAQRERDYRQAREDMDGALVAMVANMPALVERVDVLLAACERVRRLGYYEQSLVNSAHALAGGLHACKAWLAHSERGRELLGLPRVATPEERRIAQARADVERAEARYAWAKRHNYPSLSGEERRRLLEDAAEWLYRSKSELAALTGGEMPKLRDLLVDAANLARFIPPYEPESPSGVTG